jgi:hypothetical protein
MSSRACHSLHDGALLASHNLALQPPHPNSSGLSPTQPVVPISSASCYVWTLHRSIHAATFCMVLSAVLPVSLSQISGRHSGAANCTVTSMKHLRQSLGAGDKVMRLLQEI